TKAVLEAESEGEARRAAALVPSPALAGGYTPDKQIRKPPFAHKRGPGNSKGGLAAPTGLCHCPGPQSPFGPFPSCRPPCRTRVRRHRVEEQRLGAMLRMHAYQRMDTRRR